jgi:hypothetical protein
VTADLEVEAMSVIAEVLNPLDQATADRVLTWAASRYIANPDVMMKAFDLVVEQVKDLHNQLVAARVERDALRMELVAEAGGKCGAPTPAGTCDRRVAQHGDRCWQHQEVS